MKSFGQCFQRLAENSLPFLALFLLLAMPALAQEGESPVESPTGQVFRWLNFAIVFAGLVWACRKAGPFFRKRAEEISARIAEGARAREAAERQRREVAAKLAGLEKEVAAMRVEAQRAAQGEAERLREVVKAETETTERAAQAEIAAAERAARLELKMLAARLAVERAEALLRQELTPAAEAALVGSFVAGLERSAP